MIYEVKIRETIKIGAVGTASTLYDRKRQKAQPTCFMPTVPVAMYCMILRGST
jgi:hypothetical protein